MNNHHIYYNYITIPDTLHMTLICGVVGQSLHVDDPKVTIIPEYPTILNLTMKLKQILQCTSSFQILMQQKLIGL